MVDVGRREQFTAGASGILLILGIVSAALSAIVLAGHENPLVGTLALLLLVFSVLETALALLILTRHSSALKFLIRSLGERRRLRRAPALLSTFGRRR